MKLSDRCIQKHLKTCALSDYNRALSCHILESRLAPNHLSYCTCSMSPFALQCFTFFSCRTFAKEARRNKLEIKFLTFESILYNLLYSEIFEYLTLKQCSLLLQFYVVLFFWLFFCIGLLVSAFHFQHVCYHLCVCYKQPKAGFFKKYFMSLNHFFFPSFLPRCPSTLICWLVYVESSLNLRDNANSIMVDNIFNVCLYSVSKYFIKHFWVFVYQGCCPVGFCHCYIWLILVLEWYWLLRGTLWVFLLFLFFFK